MRNQPLNNLLHTDSAQSDSPRNPSTRVRFACLAMLFLMGAVVVIGRIGWVQAKLQDRYLMVLNSTTVEYELIPARAGRILGEGSEVYAADVALYSVEMHYRWLQDPPSARWLDRQVRRKLSAAELRDAALVDQTKKLILQQRESAIQRLTKTLNVTRQQFEDRRQTIEESVNRIADSVNRRHFPDNSETEHEPNRDGILLRLASSVRSALTTTPRRKTTERIVVREEESFHQLFTDVDFKAAAMVREQPHLFEGIRVVAGNRRTYPQKSVAAHVVGARTEIRDDEPLSMKQSHIVGTEKPTIGRFGVERSFNHQLRSVPGLRRVVRSYRQEILEESIERQPVSGRDVVLTLNHDLQTCAERLLAEVMLDQPFQLLAPTGDSQSPQPIPTGGSIVVMEAASGRLLAVASAPAIDLSLFLGASEDAWNAANADRRYPFISRSTAMALPPGSVMKPFTAAAAIESGRMDPESRFQCRGYLATPDEHRCLIYRLHGTGHGAINLTEALARSCNVYFFFAAQKTGFQELRRWDDQFGFGKPTGVDLPFEKPGNLPGSASNEAGADMSRETLGLAIGQSQLTVTPLQMVRAIAAIANGGWLVTPHVVSPDGVARTSRETDDRPQQISRRRIKGLSEQSLAQIREGLHAVVQHPAGTGHKTVRMNEIEIAGKTGTAETAPGKPDHAWFAGYVPARNPRFAFVVTLQHGGSGSRSAGPLAKELVRKMLQLELLTTNAAG